jgi:hypothetical protein
MWFPVNILDVLLKTKNVNNDRICREVDNIVMEVLRLNGGSLSTTAYRDFFVELLEEHILEYKKVGNIIDNVEVTCDSRNNTLEDIKAGKVNISVKYQQVHCLNITELNYTIEI